MPYKFNDARRDKFPKERCRVTSWSSYTKSLRRRGDLSIWVADAVARNCGATRRKSLGDQARYSDLAIEMCLTWRVVFRSALRKTQGSVRSLARLMTLDIAVPGFSTLSRRSTGLNIRQNAKRSERAITLIIDSTGLKMHGGNGWDTENHGVKRLRKTWRKLHLAFNPETGDIIGSELTTEHVDDETTLPELTAQIDAQVDRFLADGARDGQGDSSGLAAKFDHDVEIIVPPPKNAILGENFQRNRHIGDIAEHGRMKWQKQTGYNQRSLVEAQTGRWKSFWRKPASSKTR